jgi:hypothetical protein
MKIYKEERPWGNFERFTDTALKNIAETTVINLDCFEKDIQNENTL